jgi:hypothetical protein
VGVSKVAEYAKAVVGLIAPGAVVIGSSVLEGSDGGTAITTAEWITAAVACVVTAAGVYATPNRARATTIRVQPPVQPLE